MLGHFDGDPPVVERLPGRYLIVDVKGVFHGLQFFWKGYEGRVGQQQEEVIDGGGGGGGEYC